MDRHFFFFTKKINLAIGLLVSGALLCIQTPEASADTLKNILSVYDEEVNISTHYMAYAHRADEEGYHGVAALFRAVVRANGVNSHSFVKLIKAMGGDPKLVIGGFPVDSTRQNLDTAARVEQVEWQKMYSQFVKEAKDENIPAPIQTLTYAKTAENQHAALFHRMLDSPGLWKQKRSFFVCRFCGYTAMKRPDRQCPSCHEVNSFDEIG